MGNVVKDFGILILRVGLGLAILLGHGLVKFMGFSEMAPVFPDPLGVGSQTSLILAIFAELVCSALLIVGLFSRVVVIPLMVTMSVALFIVRGADAWDVRELACIYLIGYTALLFTGPGCFSIDKFIFRRKRRTNANVE